MSAATYPLSFEPYNLAGVQLRNRIFVSGHTTNFGENLLPTERWATYLAERAKGGVGLVFTEGIRVHPASLGRSTCMVSYDERALPGYKRAVAAVKEHGAAIFAQLLHTGRQTTNVFLRMPPWSASPLPYTSVGPVPHEMTRAEIRGVVDSFVVGAQMMADAGFDGLEVHFGHGHLLHQFLSPAVNQRTDEYGGSVENRMRFPMEVLRAVQKAVADSLVVGVRLSGEEFLTNGLDVAQSCVVAQRIQEESPVEFLNVSHSAYAIPSIGFHVAEMNYGDAPYRYITYALADAVPNVPIFAVCRHTSLEIAEETLRSGKVALVGMTRAHIADPHIMLKTSSGRESEVRPCVSCNFCIGQLDKSLGITCLMNPTVGREQEWPLIPEKASVPRKVLVVGGGPAGMEAARVAAERGHSVELWEAGSGLGGQLSVGRNGRGRGDLGKAVEYYERDLARLGVNVRLNHAGDAATVRAAGFDSVVLAAGARPEAREIPGYGTAPHAVDVLRGDLSRYAGTAGVLIDETGSWGSASAAESLAGAGATLTVVSPGDSYLWDFNLYSKGTTIDRISKLGVRIRMYRTVLRYEGGALVLRESIGGAEEIIEGVDWIVVSSHLSPAVELELALMDSGLDVHVIGDVRAPRSMLEAVYEGHVAGRAV